MPTYDFVCKRGHRREERVPMDTPEIRCAVCGAWARRQFSPAAPDQIMIGCGFHTTRSQVAGPKSKYYGGGSFKK